MFLLPMSDRDLIVTDVTPRTVDVASRAMNGRLSSLRVVKHVLISPSFTTVGSIPLSLLLLALTVGTPENGTKYYSDVIMGTVASQVTSLASVYSTVHSSGSKKTSKLRDTGLCVGNSPVTSEFPAQMASNAENVSIWWRHHETLNEIFCSPWTPSEIETPPKKAELLSPKSASAISEGVLSEENMK